MFTIRSSLRLQKMYSPPSQPKNGDVYLDANTGLVMLRRNNQWIRVDATGEDFEEVSIINNQASPLLVTGFQLDETISDVQIVRFSISRVYSSPSTELLTYAEMTAVYKNGAWDGSDVVTYGDVPETVFVLNADGTASYTSSNLSGTAIESLLRYNINTIGG